MFNVPRTAIIASTLAIAFACARDASAYNPFDDCQVSAGGFAGVTQSNARLTGRVNIGGRTHQQIVNVRDTNPNGGVLVAVDCRFFDSPIRLGIEGRGSFFEAANINGRVRGVGYNVRLGPELAASARVALPLSITGIPALENTTVFGRAGVSTGFYDINVNGRSQFNDVSLRPAVGIGVEQSGLFGTPLSAMINITRIFAVTPEQLNGFTFNVGFSYRF